MAILKRAGVLGALGFVAIAWLGCDLGLDPSMVGETASSSSTSSSSGGGAGGGATSTTSSSTGVGAGGSGGGGAGAGGGGGAGGEGGAPALAPCAPIDDFTTFENSDPLDGWITKGSINGVNVNGNRMVRAEANNAEDATMVREQSSALDACYLSVRGEPNLGPDTTYLSLACGSSSVRFVFDQTTAEASVVFVNPPVAPPSLTTVSTSPSLPADQNINYTLRVRFTDEVIFELKPTGAGSFVTTHSFARPSWMNDCFVGFGVTDIQSSLARFDDFCVDAP